MRDKRVTYLVVYLFVEGFECVSDPLVVKFLVLQHLSELADHTVENCNCDLISVTTAVSDTVDVECQECGMGTYLVWIYF